MRLKTEDIFLKIHDATEKKQILQGTLKFQHRPVIIKSDQHNGPIVAAKAVKLRQGRLICTVSGAQNKLLSQFSEVILMFHVYEEKYLMRTECRPSGKYLFVDIANSLYRLQRRNDFRIKIPVSYRASVRIKHINSKPDDQDLVVLDLSAGGCRVQIGDQIAIQLDDFLEGELKLAYLDPIPINCYVRFIGRPSGEKDKLILGLQFAKFGPLTKTRLTSIVMDVYRQIFSRLDSSPKKNKKS